MMINILLEGSVYSDWEKAHRRSTSNGRTQAQKKIVYQALPDKSKPVFVYEAATGFVLLRVDSQPLRRIFVFTAQGSSS